MLPTRVMLCKGIFVAVTIPSFDAFSGEQFDARAISK
jgi:hypothetical protein